MTSRRGRVTSVSPERGDPYLTMADLWGRFPKWMPATYHIYHIQLVLEALVGIPCSVAPVLPDAYWVVIKAPSGAAESMMWWETRMAHQADRQRHNAECCCEGQSHAQDIGRVLSWALRYLCAGSQSRSLRSDHRGGSVSDGPAERRRDPPAVD